MWIDFKGISILNVKEICKINTICINTQKSNVLFTCTLGSDNSARFVIIVACGQGVIEHRRLNFISNVFFPNL